MSVNELPLETTDINNIVSIGDPIYRMSPILPSDRFGWMIGQEFDVLEYPELALVYPSGKLPDPRYRYFKIVDITDAANTIENQSVQHLTFIGNSHSHTTTIRAAGNSHPNNQTQYFIGDGGAGNRSTTTSAVTVSGKIGGTSPLTQPNSITAYCMCRIK